MTGQPAAALAQILGVTEAELAKLVEQEVLVETRGTFDVLASVRAYAEHLRGKIPKRADWAQARRLYELDGWKQAAIAQAVGVSVQRVSQRVKSEGWVDKSAIVTAARAQAMRKFVERDTEAVLENLAIKHELNRDLMVLMRRHVDRWLNEDQRPDSRATRALRDLCLAVRTIETVDSSIVKFARSELPEADPGQTLPDLPADFDFLKALRKRPKQEAPTQ